MTILEQIVAAKRVDLEKRRELFPVKWLEQSIYYRTRPVSLCSYLKRTDRVGVIAEIKRKSPSKGVLNAHIDVEQLSIGYMQAGASALSILTDTTFFGGRSEDLSTARKFNFCPILRKDFILDPYQVIEARSIGADVILLIASILSLEDVASLSQLAHELQLEVLLEIHSLEELERCPLEHIDLIGVNNRDLKNFTVSLETSLHLAQYIPQDKVKVSESGIRSAHDLMMLKQAGYQGFLIGELFMKESRPDVACTRFIQDVLALSAPTSLAS